MAGGARGAVSVPCPVVKGEIVEVEVAEEEEPEDVSWKPSEVRACLATGRFVACVNGDEDFNEEFWPEEEVSVGLYKIVFQFKALLWKSIILLLPLPPHLQSLPYCSTIARPLRNTPPPHRTLLCMPCTIQYWRWQYRIKTKRQVARGGAPLIFTILYLLLLYSSWVNPGGLAVSCRSRSLV